MTLRCEPTPEPCACLPHAPGLMGLTCSCECHTGPPLSLALLHKTWSALQGKPHLKAEPHPKGQR